MTTKLYHFGAYRICETCKKRFFVTSLDDYAYTRYSGVRDAHGKGLKVWFCSWHCLRQWDKSHDDGRKKKKELEWEE